MRIVVDVGVVATDSADLVDVCARLTEDDQCERNDAGGVVAYRFENGTLRVGLLEGECTVIRQVSV